MNATPALVRPSFASDIDPYVALWIARLSAHTPALLNQFNDGVFSFELRTLVGVTPENDRLDRKKLLPLIHIRAAELEQMLPKRPTRLHQNIAMLGDLLELDQIQREILAYIAICNEHGYFSEFIECIRMTNIKAVIRVLMLVLGAKEQTIKNALRPEGNLIKSRILKFEFQRLRSGNALTLPENLHSALFGNTGGLEDMMGAFLEPAPKPKLAGQAFPHLDKETDLLDAYLYNATKRHVSGVNVLIYGPPGSGKTEYIRWFVTTQLGKRLFQVKASDEHGRPISGLERLSFFLIAQRFLHKSDAVILFDEIEDVFPVSGTQTSYEGETRRPTIGKMYINKLLENNPVPAFWVSNEIDQIDKAYLRRFDFSFEMDMPPASVRKTILRKYLNKLSISDETYKRLAQQSALSPAQIEKAAKVIHVSALKRNHEATLLHVIENSMDLLDQDKTEVPIDFAECRYRLDYLNADIALAPLVQQLKSAPDAKGAICLYGAPGTGKTALAHYIAREIDIPLIAKRASDIMSPYVGETEQRIASVFQQAQQEKAVLLLDEADSFLSDRKSARNSWEVTAVNEMLTQMEGFKGLFICSTNLMQRLDEASLRRFALKIKFDYLRTEQRWQLFREHVKRLRVAEQTEIRNALDQMSNLTPGDFATVRRQAQMFGSTWSAREWLERLRHESRAKRDGGSRPVGFIQPS